MRQPSDTVTPAYIALGSNLGDSLGYIASAVHQLRRFDDGHIADISALYHSPPYDGSDQPYYCNAVMRIGTTLDADMLLDYLLMIERRNGRLRHKRWAARTLDCDIVLYGDEVIHTSRLSVPHKECTNRAFVLQPLFDIVGARYQLPSSLGVLQQLSIDSSLLMQVKTQHWMRHVLLQV